MPHPASGTPRCEPIGESLLLVHFGDHADALANARVHALAACLRAHPPEGLVDLVPAYASLGVHYDPRAWATDDAPAWQRLAAALQALAATDAQSASTPRTVEVPVRYGGECGVDLARVAAHANLTADEVVRRHAAARYRVAMLGFAPGFPYLAGLDPALATPRRAEPRLRVPAGAVAIGGAQTGIYPRELPGGWNLIGWTPLRLFDAAREPACLLRAGDEVRFVPIDQPATP